MAYFNMKGDQNGSWTEPPGSINRREFLDWLRSCWVFDTGSWLLVTTLKDDVPRDALCCSHGIYRWQFPVCWWWSSRSIAWTYEN